MGSTRHLRQVHAWPLQAWSLRLPTHWTGDGPAEAVEVSEQSCSFGAPGAGKRVSTLANPGWPREGISSLAGFAFVELKTLVPWQSACLHLLFVRAGCQLRSLASMSSFGFQHDTLVVVGRSASSLIFLAPLLGMCAPLQTPL